MKTRNLVFALAAALLALAFTGCVSNTAPAVEPTSSQQLAASAVEDGLTVFLAPVLANNPDYVLAAQAVADGLATFSGTTLTAGDVTGILDAAGRKTSRLTPEMKQQLAAEINVLWGIYVRKYQKIADGNIRPDVKLFLGAIANGINAAVAAQPR